MLFRVSQISPDVELVFANADKYINVYPSYHQVGGLNYRNVNQADWEVVGNQYRWSAPMPQITDETIPVIQLLYSYNATDSQQQQQYAAFKTITSVETVSGSMHLYAPIRPSVDFRIRFRILNKMDLAVLLNRMFAIGTGFMPEREVVQSLLTGYNPTTGLSGVISGMIPAATNARAGVMPAGVLSRLAKLEGIYNQSLQAPFKIESYENGTLAQSDTYLNQTDICNVPAGTWEDDCVIYTATNAVFTDAARLFYQQQATTLDLTHVYSGNVVSFSYALACNSMLESIKGLDLLDTHSADDISYMFSDDVQLETIDLSNLDLDNVTNIEGLFKGCTGTLTIRVPNLDFTKIGVGGIPLIEQPDVFTDLNSTCTIWVGGETQRDAIRAQYPDLQSIAYN